MNDEKKEEPKLESEIPNSRNEVSRKEEVEEEAPEEQEERGDGITLDDIGGMLTGGR